MNRLDKKNNKLLKELSDEDSKRLYKKALEIIKERENKKDEEFRQKDLKTLKKFEGKFYYPKHGRSNYSFENVIKVDDIGNFISEIMTVDLDISKLKSFYSRNIEDCILLTLVGGIDASSTHNQISEKQYNYIKNLIQNFENDLRKASQSFSSVKENKK